MNSSPDHAFDDFLAQHLQQTRDYLPDDGFTAQVMNALPADNSPARRTELLIARIPVLLIGLLVAMQFPWADAFSTIWYMLIQTEPMAWLKMGLGAAAAMLVAGVFWFWQTAESL